MATYGKETQQLLAKLKRRKSDESDDSVVEQFLIRLQLVTNKNSGIFATFNAAVNESEKSYKHYREMLNSKSSEFFACQEALKSTLKMLQEQWKLLYKTQCKLAEMQEGIPSLLYSIQDMVEQLEKDQKDRNAETIEEGFKEMRLWMKQPELKQLANDWTKLKEYGEKEQNKRKKIRNEFEKRECENTDKNAETPRSSSFPGVLKLSGLCLIIAACAIAFFAPQTIPILGMTISKVAAVSVCGASGFSIFGGGMYCARSSGAPSGASSGASSCTTSKFDEIEQKVSQIVSNQRKIEKNMQDLADELKRAATAEKELTKYVKQAQNNDKWDRATCQLKLISGKLKKFQKLCKQTVKIINKARKNIAFNA